MLADIMLFVNGDLSDAALPMRQRKGVERLSAAADSRFVNAEQTR
jgi:hypothetical protein